MNNIDIKKITPEFLREKLAESRKAESDEFTLEQILVQLWYFSLYSTDHIKVRDASVPEEVKTELQNMGFYVQNFGYPINETIISYGEKPYKL